ncbi:MAG: hypothetical protein WCA93_06885, partial [Acidimicrobiia bacterium]
MTLLVRSDESPTGWGRVVQVVDSGSGRSVEFEVGLDSSGQICAQAGTASTVDTMCGGHGPATVGFEARGERVVAGYVPSSIAEVVVVYGSRTRRVAYLKPVPGWDAYAFGLTGISGDPVDIEFLDDQGTVLDRRSVTLGSLADALDWEKVPVPGAMTSAQAGVVWTGTELILAGASSNIGSPTITMAYSPESGTWRELSDIPGYLFPPAKGVWTGSEAVFCCVMLSDTWLPDHPVAYDPDTDTWRIVEESPFIDISPFDMAWTGAELIVVGSEGVGSVDLGTGHWEVVMGPDGAIDPKTGQWEYLAEPMPLVVGRDETVWTGHEIVFLPVDAYLQSTGMAYDLADRSWRVLPELPGSTWPSVRKLAYTGSELIVWGLSGEQHLIGSRLDLDANRWVEMATALPDPEPCDCREEDGLTMLWSGERLLVSTGRLGRGFNPDDPLLLAYHPTTDTWTNEGVSPLGLSEPSTALMAGDRVVFQTKDYLYISPPGWQPHGTPI